MDSSTHQGRGTVVSWADFAQQAPDHGRAGARLLGLANVGVAFLATVSRDGRPRMAPVCPILSRHHLYLCVVTRSPKARDLANHGSYVLHAALGDDDEEFQISGRALRVSDPQEVSDVQANIRFQFHAKDPLFRLELERCLWVHWEKPGQPGTRPVRQRWRAD